MGYRTKSRARYQPRLCNIIADTLFVEWILCAYWYKVTAMTMTTTSTMIANEKSEEFLCANEVRWGRTKGSRTFARGKKRDAHTLTHTDTVQD